MNGTAEASERPPFDLVVIATTGVVGHLLLACGAALPAWILPAALAVAVAWRRRGWPAFDGWLPAIVAVFGTVAIAYGCLATQDRSWDGFATWSLTARHLAAGATLDAPYFANPSVYVAAPGYPLLQPILLQQTMAWFGEQGGRILFPCLWLALLFAVREPLRALQLPSHLRALAVAGLALVPLFVEPGHGSAESGFADLLLALLVTHGAAAILLGRTWTALLVGLCLPLCKNEGVVHVAGLVAAAAFCGSRRTAWGVAVGAAVALAAWLPLQLRLLRAPGSSSWLAVGAVALAPLALCAWGVAVRVRRTRTAALVAGGVAVLSLPFVIGRIATGVGPAAAALTTSIHWSASAKVLAAVVGQLCWVRKLGLSFVLLVAAIACAVAARRRGASAAAPDAAPLFVHLAAVLVAVVLFLLTRPAEQLALFLREGTVRYLSQVLGVAWLAVGILLHRLGAGEPRPAEVGP